MPQFLALLLLLLVTVPNGKDYILFQWASGLALASLSISWWVKKRIGGIPALALAYTLISGVYVFLFKENHYQALPEALVLLLSHGSLFATAALLFVGGTALLLPKKAVSGFLLALPHFTLLNSVAVISGFVTQTGRLPYGHGYCGFLDYASLNGSLIAMGVPHLLAKRSWIGAAFAIIAITLSKSSMPYGVLVLGVGGYLFKKFPGKRLPLFLAIGFPFLLGLLLEGPFLFHSAGRFEAYELFMGAWWDNANIWFGTGPGTFQVIAPGIQEKAKFMVTNHDTLWLWLWLHSDWIQLVFELGVVGFILWGLVIGKALTNYYFSQSDEAPALFGALLALCGSGIFNFPVRYFTPALLLSLLVVHSYGEPRGFSQEVLDGKSAS